MSEVEEAGGLEGLWLRSGAQSSFDLGGTDPPGETNELSIVEGVRTAPREGSDILLGAAEQ